MPDVKQKGLHIVGCNIKWNIYSELKKKTFCDQSENLISQIIEYKKNSFLAIHYRLCQVKLTNCCRSTIKRVNASTWHLTRPMIGLRKLIPPWAFGPSQQTSWQDPAASSLSLGRQHNIEYCTARSKLLKKIDQRKESTPYFN